MHSKRQATSLRSLDVQVPTLYCFFNQKYIGSVRIFYPLLHLSIALSYYAVNNNPHPYLHITSIYIPISHQVHLPKKPICILLLITPSLYFVTSCTSLLIVISLFLIPSQCTLLAQLLFNIPSYLQVQYCSFILIYLLVPWLFCLYLLPDCRLSNIY